jgi:hypothetical protein
VIPDIEAAVVAFLLSQEEVTDIVGEHGVATTLPAGAALPRVRITLGGGRVVVPRWFYAPRLTVEAWAETKAEAFQLITTTLNVLETGLPAAQVSQGVVTACEMDTGILWSPDPAAETPRYLGSVVAYIHPNPNQ